METSPQTAMVLAAQAGDQMAFETLVNAYRWELLMRCYQMFGSVHDAEDLVQETLLRAWLYLIATNLWLDKLRSAPRRSLSPETHPVSDPSSPLPERVREPIRLEPFPDDLLADLHSDPYNRAESRVRITLAFLVALQRLTPVRRAILPCTRFLSGRQLKLLS